MARENKGMQSAKDAKNDEFYTLYADIQKEINMIRMYSGTKQFFSHVMILSGVTSHDSLPRILKHSA